MLKNRFNLRAEDQPPARLRKVQGFDSETVTGKEKAPTGSVPHSQAKHPAQVLHAFITEVLIKMDDHFGIAGGLERMAAAL